MFFSNLLMSGSTFSPASLFASGEQGVWYDPSDFSSLWQDAQGTTAVTGVEQAVGLILDRRNGRGLGTELVTNNTFATDTDWTKGTGWSIGSGVATKSAGSASVLSQAISLTAGFSYRLVYTITRTAGAITPQFTGGSTVAGTARSAAGTFVEVLTAVPGNTTLEFSADASFAGTVDNVYVKRVSGNDAWQLTSASRPVLRARYNLLTYSEQFDNAAWVKTGLLAFGSGSVVNTTATTDPLGTNTAELIVPTAASTVHSINLTVANSLIDTDNLAYTVSICAKSAGYDFLRINMGGGAGYATFNLSSGTVEDQTGITSASITALGNGWYRCSITDSFGSAASIGQEIFSIGTTAGAGVDIYGRETFTGDGTSGIYVWGADTRVTNESAAVPAYQRIEAATSYDTEGFLPYLAFDGSDDSLATAAIDFSATDEMSVFAGVRKLSDAAFNLIVELSTNTNTNTASFFLGSNDSGSAEWSSLARGDAAINVNQGAYDTTVAPDTAVIAATHDISDDLSTLRRNGVAGTNGVGNKGAGNFGAAYPLYIGRRGGSTVPFNGRIYSLIVRGKTSTADEITAAEAWVNSKTGAY